MATQSALGSDLFDGKNYLDDDPELDFQSNQGAEAHGLHASQDWDTPSCNEQQSESHSPYENLLEQRWRELAASGTFTGFPIPADAEASYLSEKHGISGGTTASVANQLVLPGINEEIYGFHLRYELGKGAFARVFLANQGDLAGREVVLKISRIEGFEAQTLAQLQHTHVVPIYSVHQDKNLGLRAVCMPYFGGACLAKVQEKVWDGRGLPVSGRALIEALDSVAGPAPAVRGVQHADNDDAQPTAKAHLQSSHAARNTLSNLTYVQASAWIVCRLAEGLHHSHERNVIHRDIKPSNILISAEAQPLLLDFNVSQAIDCDLADITLGGTISYMSPEQLRAVIVRDVDSLKRVEHQSDIYSLGLVLYEMLNGPSPFRETVTATVELRSLKALLQERERPVPSLKSHCAIEIPWSLESIVRKSLAPDPAERYKSAAQMAEDLNRFLQDLPLKFAPELSRIEQVKKWSRRHPKLISSGIVVLLALALILPGLRLLNSTAQSLHVAQDRVAIAKAVQQARDFHEGADRALCLVNTVTPDEVTFRSGMAACDETLAIFGIVTNLDWQEGTSWQHLTASDRESVSESARELLLVLASAHVRTLPGKDTAVLTALSLLKKAEAIRDLPPSRALFLDRARYLSLLKRDVDAKKAIAQAEVTPVRTAHDLYMLASAHSRFGTKPGYREAVKLLTKAIEQSPKHYWSYFARALCQQELGETLLTVTDLGTCIGLWPESSWAYFNRGFLLDQKGQKYAAIQDYSHAIKHNPRFMSPYFNRGLVYLELRQPSEALNDFAKARDLGRQDSILDAARAMALAGLGRNDEADQLFAEVLNQNAGAAEQTAQSRSEQQIKQRIERSYAFAISHRKPEISLQIFNKILKLDPKDAKTHYGKGMLSMNAGRLQDAVGSFDAAIEAAPKFIEPLRYRAILRARMGKLTLAGADANACVDREPTNPDSLYIAACVAAISYRKLRTADIAQTAVELLRKAIACGADPERAVNDPDFSALRDLPEFRELVRLKSIKSGAAQRDT
ncbi:MAG: serine/threonine protein kinase [Planctomycetaceae bacterium]|nr:serine/threonine protein kinase [Planctomycetaceae bacterium]